MKQKEKKKAAVVSEYLGGGVTYRELERKYGYGAATIYRWVKRWEKKREESGKAKVGISVPLAEVVEEESASAEIRRLRFELKKAELHNELLNAMIDIAEEDLGVDIRKKRGPGR